MGGGDPVFFFFARRPAMKHARKKEKKKEKFRKNTNYGPDSYTGPTLGVGGGALCCIATALRGLGHQFCREMVRSDKFVNSTAIS